MQNNEVNVLVSKEDTTTPANTQKKFGRKFIMAVIGTIVGILTAIVNNSSEIVTIAGLALVGISSLTYMITEGKLDLASIQNIVNTAGQIADVVEDMDLPCLDGDAEEVEEPENSENETPGV